jgi:hypothetical protein
MDKNFKAGDLVRYIKHIDPDVDHLEFEIDKTYKVRQVDGYHRLFVEGTGIFLFKNQVGLPRIRNTKLARKIYPDYREEGEWLYADNKKDN